jgi:hypothetical protein
MGSGTTIACAVERGYKATGTDINEVAYLITRAKATPIEPTRLEPYLDRWIHSLDPLFTEAPKDGQSTFLPLWKPRQISPHVPAHERIDYWFSEDQQRILGLILSGIRKVEVEDIQTFLLCGFSHVLKNCSIWMNSSTKPTRSRTKKPAHPWPTFLRHLRKMARRNKEFWNAVPAAVQQRPQAHLHVRCQDARHQPCPDDTVDMVITSSPYVTSYEYADLHQLTALWLEYARDLKAFRSKFIGTRMRPPRPPAMQSTLAQAIVDNLTVQDVGLGITAGQFFMDMDETFAESYRILKPGGRACFVIGNTRLKGVDILNAQVFAQSLVAVGFHLEDVIMREIPSKILPQIRDPHTGRFTSTKNEHTHAYPVEYVVVVQKP